jgi:putative 4-hydroxybenzoate polyprenyltransferase
MNSIEQHMQTIRQMVMPWQTFSGIFWLFSGIFVSSEPLLRLTDGSIVILIIAVVLARTSGMLWNRWLDRHIDGENPRTASRALPSGKISSAKTFFYAVTTLLLFLITCFFLPTIWRYVGLFVALFVVVYSMLKRVTCFCHFFLGVIHGALPLVGSFWIAQSISTAAVALSLSAFASIAGTDILYATQDEAVDQRLRLRSIPARFGSNFACRIAAVLHVFACICLLATFSQACIASYGLLAGSFYILWCKWDRFAFSFFLLFFPMTAFIIAGVDRLCHVL